MRKVNLTEKFGLFSEQWSPKIIGELNGQVIKIAKIKGEFVWHKHDDEDEFFLVNKGKMTIQLPDQTIELKQGEFVIVPRGIEHKPIAEEEAEILMFEPAGTLNTGDVRDQRTIDELDYI
jgi:quercetin dioxygenase-like cupin family protein